MCRINRRQFVIGGVSAVAGAPVLLSGCATAALTLIPVFQELAFQEILAVIGKATFELYGPSKTSYSAAEYWREKPSNWQDFAARKIVEFYRDMEAKFLGQRKLVLDTPIISCTADRNILMQVGPAGRWSLVTGGKNGDEVFGVNNDYLSWWIERGRNHALTFDGHTSGPEPCGQCELLGMRQRFITNGGAGQELFLPLEPESSWFYRRFKDARDLIVLDELKEKHAKHSEEWDIYKISGRASPQILTNI